MEKKPAKYIAIDSDILRKLAYLDMLQTKNKTIDVEKIKDEFLRKNYNYFTKLFNFVKEDKLRLLIVDAVYQESKFSPSLTEFIRKYCYFQNINAANYQEKAEESRRLALAYCKPYTLNGKQKDAPMQLLFVADINKSVPTNDCYIMAQATIEQCCLLTGNGKHFVFNERTSKYREHERVLGIVQINISMGYSEPHEKSGSLMAPKPMLLHDLMPILINRGLDSWFTLAIDDDKIKASELLDESIETTI